MASNELKKAYQWELDFGAALGSVEAIEDMRRLNAEWLRDRQQGLPVGFEVTDSEIGGVPVVWLGPEQSDDRVVLFVHGGGYILGSTADGYEMLSRVLGRTGGRALGVEYRLAPENPHPAQLDDVCTVYRALLDGGQDPAKVAFLGESAGGGIAFATLSKLRDAGDSLPSCAALLSPLMDFELRSASLEHNAEVDPFVNREVLKAMIDAALQGQDAAQESPMSADAGGLPPLLIQAGTAETLFDDAERVATRAGAAGVDVTFEAWEEMIHLWHGFPYLPEAVEATEKVGDFIAAHQSRNVA